MRDHKCEFTVRDAREMGACDYAKRRRRLREVTGLKGHALDRLRINVIDVLEIWGVGDAIWTLRWCSDRRTLVQAIWPAVLRAQDAAGVGSPGYVQDIQKWIDGDDAVDLGEARAAARSARSARAVARAASRAAAWAAARAAEAAARAASRAAARAAAADAEAAEDAAAWAAEAAEDAAAEAALEAERVHQADDLRALFGAGLLETSNNA